MEKETVKTEGDYRAVIEREEYSYAPDGDYQAAVIRLDYSGYYDADAKNSAANEFEDAAKHFMSYYGMNKGIDVFKRYLTLFHGTQDIREFHYSYSPDSARYLAFDSADMRKVWGCAEDATDAAAGTAEEWQAYIDGDTYSIAVERRITASTVSYFQGEELGTEETEDWEELADTVCGGFYGEKWAREAAEELLSHYSEKG